MSASGAAGRRSEPGSGGKAPLGGPGRRARPAMVAGLAVGLAAIAGLALSGADAAAAACAVALGLGALAVGWGFGERGHGLAGSRSRDQHERAQTRPLRARDRPGRDGPAPVDGGRVPRRGHRRAHRAHRPLLRAAGRTHRHGRGLLRAAAPRRAAARRRQGRDPRRDPAEARPAHAGGARDRRDPRRGGAPPRSRLVLLDPRHGGDDRPQPPGEVGRQRLPARPEGRGDPDRGPHRRRRRRLRRAHQRPRLSQGVLGRRGDRDDARTARAPLRPGSARRVHGSARPLRPGRARGASPRPRRARRVDAGDLRDGARTRRRRDGRGRDRDRDRGRHHADHAPRRGDRPFAAQARRALRRRANYRPTPSTAPTRSCAVCWPRSTAT